MSEQDFRSALSLIIRAYHGLKKPEDERQYELMVELLDGYIAILSGLNKDVFDNLRNYILTNEEIDEHYFHVLYTLYTQLPDPYVN